jgi:calmodulin
VEELELIGLVGSEEVKEAFRVFDTAQTGSISVEDLKHIMTTMGEPMSTQEVDDMIREAGGGPSINYTAFVDKMKRNT